jgi:YesN/AraC family two-component response regulator
VLYDFLLNQVSRQHSVQDYLLFKNNGANNRDIRLTLDSLIEEYYRQREFADTIINAQLTVLIARLIRNYQLPSAPVSPSQEIAIKILDDIRTHYRKLNLEELAQKYAYNKNYLSNLFRKEVGKPFSEVLTDERLLRAREMIQSTTKPIGDICHDVGIANKSFFYHKYADKFGHTPKEDRQNASPDTILEQL